MPSAKTPPPPYSPWFPNGLGFEVRSCSECGLVVHGRPVDASGRPGAITEHYACECTYRHEEA